MITYYLFIKKMQGDTDITAVQTILKNLGHPVHSIRYGEIAIGQELRGTDLKSIRKALSDKGYDLNSVSETIC